MISLLSTLLFMQQRTVDPATAEGTGLEWMVIATGVVPAVLLLIIIYAGSRRTV